MENINAEIHAILLFYFVKGKSVEKHSVRLILFLDNSILALLTAEERSPRCRVGEDDTMDKPVAGRPVTTNTEKTRNTPSYGMLDILTSLKRW